MIDQLRWLPALPDWRVRLRTLGSAADPWTLAVSLANARVDFTGTSALDRALASRLAGAGSATFPQAVRLAVLGSSTLAHLHAGIRVAGLRRTINIGLYESAFGQYMQELLDATSALHAFRPDLVLFAFDAAHLTQGLNAAMTTQEADAALADALARTVRCWTLAQEAFACPVMQQAALDVFPPLLGSNEHRLPGSRSRFVARFNDAVRTAADTHGVDIVALDHAARQDGIRTWHDPVLWHRAKQEVSPALSPTYGELVARVIAARRGRSAKCLVLDLDDTIWGGVVGEDGLDGIVLGQGSALGEGFVAVQAHAKELAGRGIILAVCSKNDKANALEPFDRHPEMVLRRPDIACFRANWQDKAANLRAIAEELNIGLDSMVFLDDNAFERNLVRAELPMVAVPEVPDDDPGRVPDLLADAGYFESVGITQDDLRRSARYQDNRVRQALRADATDMDSYLRALDMHMVWSRFDGVGRTRVVQLINKTNQFNLTTRRHDEAAFDAIMADPHAFGLQVRLTDRFGDNGIIAIVIGRLVPPEPGAPATVLLDTWLMSCRVLGRGVERAVLHVVVQQTRVLGAARLLGEYRPTPKNAMVRDHYTRLGFSAAIEARDGGTMSILDLDGYEPSQSFIRISEGGAP